MLKKFITFLFMDKAMVIGALLVGILGFIIPVVEIVSSSIAFPHFIEPMVKGILRWIAGLIVGICCFYSWLTFGFCKKECKTNKDMINKIGGRNV
jgi:hypothetical protein